MRRRSDTATRDNSPHTSTDRRKALPPASRGLGSFSLGHKTRKSTLGGKRAGAGRKPTLGTTASVQVATRVASETKAALEASAAACGETPSAWIRGAIRARLKKDDRIK